LRDGGSLYRLARSCSKAEVLSGSQSRSACVPPLRWQADGREAGKSSALPRESFTAPLLPVQPVRTRKGHRASSLSFNRPNPSVGVLVGSVSDEGGFWASMAVRPRGARKPMRAKTDRIRGCGQRLKQRQNHCETRLIGDQYLSPGGDRVGDTLKRFEPCHSHGFKE
jgi:hypothetical protein